MHNSPVEQKGQYHLMIHDCGGVEACGGVLWSVGECDGVCLSDEMKCDGWSPQLQKVRREIFKLALRND